MRAIRTWGSVRGVPGDWYPYRDQCGDATRAPTQGPDQAEGDRHPQPPRQEEINLGRQKRAKSQGFGGRPPWQALFLPFRARVSPKSSGSSKMIGCCSFVRSIHAPFPSA